AYRPADQDSAAPLLVFAHFGGGVIGDLDTCHAFCGMLARYGRCAVLSVDYRLAPEHRFPAGLEDMLAAWRWARDNTTRFGAPAGRLAIGGDSMGGNFAAILAQAMKAAGEPQPVLQLLIYPAVDVASETRSMTTYADAYPLSRDTMTWFMGHYMGPDDDPADPRLSPIRASDLTGLAPAIVVTAGFDPLVDQGEAYARQLKAAGVPVTYRCYDALAHGFTAFTGAIPAADAACREIAGLVRQAFDSAAS
ncbi:MAG: alpha/beta hydrolase, partial [Caulobacteraceae bacterium]